MSGYQHTGLRDNTPIKPSKAWGYLNTAFAVIVILSLVLAAETLADISANSC